MNKPSVIPLRPSAQVTTAGTTTGTAIELLQPHQSLTVVFDLTVIGDNTQAADTLDVYVDAGYYDAVAGAIVWINIGRFTQITGVDAVAASGTLTLTGAIVPGSHAESVVTANTILDGDTLTIGSTVYRFKTVPDQAFDVALGANDAAALDNLKLAINANGVGDGSDYFAGTTAHPTVVATDNADTTQKVVARVPGTAANTAATTSSGATLSWPDTTLGGGTGASNPGVAPETVTIGSKVYSFVDVLSETNAPAAAIANQILFGADSAAALDNLKSAINGTAGEGTTFSTGTVAHTQVTAGTNTNTTQEVTYVSTGSAGNSVATTETLTNGSWGAATLTGGTAGPGVTDRQTLAWSNTSLEGTQPVNSDADLGSAGVRKIGFLQYLRYRGVAAGAQPEFTYSVIAIAK